MGRLAALLGAAAGVGLCEGAKQAAPTVTPSFTTPVRTSWAGNSLSDRTEYIIYDATSRRWRYGKTVNLLPFANINADTTLVQDNYALEGFTLTLTNGQCTDASPAEPPTMTGGFGGMLEWVQDAEPVGQKVIRNRTCTAWHHAALNRTLYLDGDTPVLLEDNAQVAGNVHPWSMEFLEPFGRFADASELELPSVCMRPPVVCGSKEVKVMTVYLLHPRDEFDISNQDVADAKGDVTFMCSSNSWKSEDYELVSVYEVSVLQQFGQYLNCNFYDPPFCLGSEHFYVGREAPSGMGTDWSQCEDAQGWRELLGTWYSLPQGGQCTQPGHTIGTDCTWRVERRVKTIELSCLLAKNDFLDKCTNTSMSTPTPGMTDVFLRAFESDDYAKGGCPALPGPSADGALQSSVLVA